jgi:hypothetical protein
MDAQRMRIQDRIRQLEEEMAIESDFEQRSNAESGENNEEEYGDEQDSDEERELRTYNQNHKGIENAYGNDDNYD